MVKHQEYIIAIKDAIKPGLELCFKKPFEREMVAKYLNKIHQKEYVEDERLQKSKIEKNMKVDIEIHSLSGPPQIDNNEAYDEEQRKLK